MASTAAKLVYAAIACAIIGSVVLLLGPSLPFPPLLVLIIGNLNFIIVIIVVIFALYFKQRESTQNSESWNYQTQRFC